MKKQRMVLASIVLACLLMLGTGVALASATGVSRLTDEENRAVALIEQVFGLSDAMAQADLLFEAVEAAPESPLILVECANLLRILNKDGALTERIEAMLRKAATLAEGELRAQAYQAIGDLLLETRGTGAVTAFINQELERTPGDDTLRVMLAKVYFFDERTDDALAVLDALLADVPDHFEAARLRAVLLNDAGRWEEALHAYELMESKFPDKPYGLYGRYLVYIALGEFDRAARAIDEEIKSSGNDYLWLERANLRLFRQQNPELALKEANALVKAEPDWVDAFVAKLNALLILARYEEAMEVADQVFALDEGIGRMMQSIALSAQGRWDEAKPLMLKALEETYLQRSWSDAVLLYMQGYDDIDSAMDAVKKSFAVIGNEFFSYMRLGQIYSHQGQYLEAARAFYRAEAYAQSDAQAMQWLVLTMADAGREEDAFSQLAIMEQRYPGWYETMLTRVMVEETFHMPDAALMSFVVMREKFPYAAARMRQLEAILLLGVGDAKGLSLMEAWMNEQDADSLLAWDWSLYAHALLLARDTEKAGEAIAMAETLLSQIDPSHGDEIRNTKSLLRSIQAERARLEGDMEGCVALLREAAELGFVIKQDTLYTADEEPYPSAAYDALYAEFGPDQEAWDITVHPKMPK